GGGRGAGGSGAAAGASRRLLRGRVPAPVVGAALAGTPRLRVCPATRLAPSARTLAAASGDVASPGPTTNRWCGDDAGNRAYRHRPKGAFDERRSTRRRRRSVGRHTETGRRIGPARSLGLGCRRWISPSGGDPRFGVGVRPFDDGRR